MTTRPYIILHEDDDCCIDVATIHFPDPDGKVVWYLTKPEAAEYHKLFTDYNSPLYERGYYLVEVVENQPESRQVILDALVTMREFYAKQAAEAKRKQETRDKQAADKKKAAAEKKAKELELRLLQEAESKRELYLRLKEEFEEKQC